MMNGIRCPLVWWPWIWRGDSPSGEDEGEPLIDSSDFSRKESHNDVLSAACEGYRMENRDAY